MRITKALIAKLDSDLHRTLGSLTKEEVAYIVKKSNEAYHAAGKPFLSDEVFDQVKGYLLTIDHAAAEAQEVGAAPIKGKKVNLPYYMGSMDKIKTDDRALVNYTTKFVGNYLLTDKLDGISALLYVKNGNVTLYTRGDGTVGQDITHLLAYVQGIPPKEVLVATSKQNQSTGFNGEMTIRGELIMTKADFESVKTRGANARNMVAGIVNAKKPDVPIAKLVKFMAYTLICPATYSPSAAMQTLQTLGFNVVYSHVTQTLVFADLSHMLVKRREQSPFEIDGIVITHNAPHPLESGKNPSYAFAFKNIITQETAEVIVSNVEWNASKDGYLVPVVEFQAVKLSGVMVKRASGFNGEFIKTNSIGPGAKIIVTRSGDVIPYILQILSPAAQPQMPSEVYAWTESGKDIYLENATSNPQVQLRQLENFFSKLNVPGMKAGTIAKLFNAGFDDLQKIIKANVSMIEKVDGFQTKSAEKIVLAIKEKLAELSCVDLMDASNAFGRGFGSKRLQSILAAIPRISDDVYMPNTTELMAIEGVSDKTATAFLKGLHAYRLFKKDIGVKCTAPRAQHAVSSSSRKRLGGQLIVFTGFRDAALKSRIEAEGGEVGDTITKKTTILVAKDLSKATGKVEKAKESGVGVFDINKFKEHFKL